MPTPTLLFIDTNIWLDFYRARNETGLKLLNHVEALADRLIVTYQLELEFKKNRQAAILEGMKTLKEPEQIAGPGIFSDIKDTAIAERSRKEMKDRVRLLRSRLVRVLRNPAANDPVYQVCQRVFHKADDLNLTRDNSMRRTIRRKAFRRFLHGCPPRKDADTSIGDPINWEWMIKCAADRRAGLVIVTRDTDYGAILDNASYINDHLRQEFSERVSRRRKLILYSRLSDALKLFKVEVSAQEKESEDQLVTDAAGRADPKTVPLSVITGTLPLQTSAIDLLERLYGLRSKEAVKQSQ
ncbi:MAG TPA: PIN domain-containing protein [Candidatus Acidoferrales bacterium]|nr:PIN domain-containing protein [Candidatus Acidoferrales bacterium]